MSKQETAVSSEIIEFWKNKRILITGGSSGLGRALAVKVVTLGSKTAVIARNPAGLGKLGNDYHKIGTIQADMSKKEAIYRISAQAAAMLGGIDILVNNASSIGKTPLDFLIDTDCEDLEEVIQTNVLGPFRLTKAVLPEMLLRGSGLVVNISSDAAVGAYARWGAYGISKAGIDHMTRIWSEELNGTGVKMISIDPGDMYTPMQLAANPGADPRQYLDPVEVAEDLIRFLAKNHFTSARFGAQEWRRHT